MSPYLDIFNAASAKQKGQRFGLGMLNMGASNANPNLMAALAQQDESHRRQDAANQLNNAFAFKDAQVRGGIPNLIGIAENRAGGKAGMANQNANAAANRWSQFQIRPGFWATMLNNATQGIGQGLAAAAVPAGGL